MARILSRTLIPNSQTPKSPSLSLSLSLYRFKSKRPEKAQLLEVDLGSSSDEPGSDIDQVLGMRRLQDAIHGIIIRRSAPDWLPFIPGSSYWVPPRKKPFTVVDLGGGGGGRVSNNRPVVMRADDEEVISFASVNGHGWPSSSYFVKGVLPTYSINNGPEKISPNSGDDSTLENVVPKSDGED